MTADVTLTDVRHYTMLAFIEYKMTVRLLSYGNEVKQF